MIAGFTVPLYKSVCEYFFMVLSNVQKRTLTTYYARVISRCIAKSNDLPYTVNGHTDASTREITKVAPVPDTMASNR